VLLPDTAVVRVRDPHATALTTTFHLGDSLEVDFGAADEDTVRPVFKGEIVVLEPEFGQGDCVVAARADDRGWRLNRQRQSRTFQDQTAEDMVKTVAAACGLTPGEVESTGAVHDFFQQSMETDWEFCWRLATMYDFEFVVDDTRFHFRAREKAAPAVTLTWGDKASLISLKPRMSGIGQVKDVTVAGHDPKAAQPLVGRASSPRIAATSDAVNGRGGAVGTLQGGSVVVADRVVTTQREADKVAQSTLDRLAKSFVEAEGRAFGDPRLRAGATVKLENVGPFSGEYVIAQTTHTYRGGSGYMTAFTVSGRTAHTFSDLLKRDAKSNWASSLVVGVVTNNNDPDDMGRVRVKYPALGDNIEGWWARVATINAGQERGLFMLPQVGDEVVVAFEHGDPRRPFVLGSLYTGQDKLPEDLHDGQDRKAAFGVKSDHKVHIEGKQAMTLRTGETLVIEVNRDGRGGTGDVRLDAKGTIDEKAANAFKMSAGQTIEISADQSVKIHGVSGVTIEASGSLKLSGASVDINAVGAVNVSGAVINLG
jgi:uncharacterized protein involved in type VI secretion and phage assembly